MQKVWLDLKFKYRCMKIGFLYTQEPYTSVQVTKASRKSSLLFNKFFLHCDQCVYIYICVCTYVCVCVCVCIFTEVSK